ncbi:MAG: hypothetical protein L0Y56_09170, partial [Nitrospira sp.]|nr:hypothetical protein [Nitrospira sp.]
NCTSYEMKRDFEKVGFHINNGQFKGAMLEAGYTPTEDSSKQVNWVFRSRPRAITQDKQKLGQNTSAGYTLSHLSPEERRMFNELVKRATEGERKLSVWFDQ